MSDDEKGWLTSYEDVPGPTVTIDHANRNASLSWRGGFRSGVAFTLAAAAVAALVAWALR